MEQPVSLTLKQKAFADHWILTRNCLASYKHAYDWKGTDANAYNEGVLLRNHVRVSAYIIENLEYQMDKMGVTPEWIMERLSQEAVGAASDGARATNLKTMAQIRGMLVQKIEHVEKSLPDDGIALSIAGLHYLKPPQTPDELDNEDKIVYHILMDKINGDTPNIPQLILRFLPSTPS